MRLLTFAASAAAFASRYPNPGGTVPGTVDLQAAAAKADKTEPLALEASAFRGFAPGDKLVCVKATTPFFVAGEVVAKGDVIEVTASEARYLKSTNKAHAATDEEIAAAKKAK
jgi:hypothetical protein